MALLGGLKTLKSLKALRGLLKTSATQTTQDLVRLLWRHGWPSRVVALPRDWWDQASELEGGLWIAADQQSPAQWWLVQQRQGAVQIHALTAAEGSTSHPQDFQPQAVSLWPAMAFSTPARWSDLQRQLKPFAAIRSALPAAFLRAGTWLMLPMLLIALLGQLISVPVALFLAGLSLLFGQVLDNQWHRLWLNRSERQRAGLGLVGMQKVLRLQLPVIRTLGGAGATALALSLQQIGHQLPLAIGRLLPAITLFLFSNLALWIWRPPLGAVSLFGCGLWLLANHGLSERSQRQRNQQLPHQGLALLRSQELIENCSTLRLAKAEQQALNWWIEPERAAEQQQPWLDWLSALQSWSAVVLATMLIMAAIVIAPVRSDQWLALSLVGIQFATSRELGQAFKTWSDLKHQWKGAQVLVNSPSESRPGASDPGELNGDLEVRNLSFRYGADTPLVLSNVSFSVQAGSFVAIVGSSGSGKSTLLRILLGFEQPLTGQVIIDGQDTCDLQHESLRRQIGTVLQDTRLVGNSLMEVIAAGRPLSVEEAWKAAEDAGLSGDLQALPMGLQTLVPAGGSNLSGGQRQRLAIARALAGQPRLLLLDEPTSALDNTTQAHVLRNLEQRAMTRVMVAHRLSTIQHADVILVLENGEIVEQGSYNDLLKQQGAFTQLMARQLI